MVVGLVAYVVVVWTVERVLAINGAVQLSRPLALVIAGVPAALWLGFFYYLDRFEPEPKDFVIGVFVLGALIAAPISDFLIRTVDPSQPLAVHGLSPFTFERTIHAVLVLGLGQELCKYVVVRYTIYSSQEFDEPMDGVVYMMAAGTGFAVWLNYQALAGLGHEVILSHAAANAVVTTLAHASFAGVLGYTLGRAKFTRRTPLVRTLLLFLGLILAATLNGQFQLVESWVSTSGLAQEPWKGIGYAALFAVLVFALLMLASRRLLRDSPFRPREEGPR
jgi:RsiW-degrading membrane proteinase PrsW (M82 family)